VNQQKWRIPEYIREVSEGRKESEKFPPHLERLPDTEKRVFSKWC
jgi:hypothetical protein